MDAMYGWSRLLNSPNQANFMDFNLEMNVIQINFNLYVCLNPDSLRVYTFPNLYPVYLYVIFHYKNLFIMV